MNKKIALVTGGNRGIGFAIVKMLLKREYVTIMTARDQGKGEEAMSKLGNPEDLHFYPLDVDDQQSVYELTKKIKEDFDGIHALINNAGINYDTWHNASNADLDEVHQTFETNLFGPWRMCQAFLPMMKEKGYGRIVNVSSGAGAFAGMGEGTPGYSASKAALNVLSVKLGKEFTGTDILINSVCPGWVRTDMGGMNATRSPEEGADGIVWLAELPTGGPTGKFFRDRKEIAF